MAVAVSLASEVGISTIGDRGTALPSSPADLLRGDAFCRRSILSALLAEASNIAGSPTPMGDWVNVICGVPATPVSAKSLAGGSSSRRERRAIVTGAESTASVDCVSPVACDLATPAAPWPVSITGPAKVGVVAANSAIVKPDSSLVGSSGKPPTLSDFPSRWGSAAPARVGVMAADSATVKPDSSLVGNSGKSRILRDFSSRRMTSAPMSSAGSLAGAGAADGNMENAALVAESAGAGGAI